MKLAAMIAISALAMAPAAFAQNTMSSSKAPMKQDSMMKSDAKEDMGEKKMASHHRMKHHMKHHRKHHRKMHSAMRATDASMATDKGAMAPKK